MSHHDHVTIQATERVLKARAELIQVRRFYGVLVSQVEPVPSRQYPTMATNGQQHFFNPDFIATLTQDELLGVQAHESEHDARHHGTRRNGRDPEEWNIACDYAINIDLIAEGFTLPKGALIDPKYAGMSAEDIYRSRELDRQREQQQQQPDDADEDEGDDEGNESGGDDADDQSGDDDQTGDDAGPDGGEDGTDGDDADGGQGTDGEEADDAEAGAGGGSEAEGEGGEGTGQTEGPSTGSPEPEGTEGSGNPDPGRCGQVLDSATDGDGDDAEDSKWERVVRQAASMARAVGQLPGHVQAIIEKANEGEQDWREVLRAWIDQGSRHIETWNRPNKRFAGSGLYLPAHQRDGINHVVFIRDTSGSVDDLALALVGGEIQNALDNGAIDRITIIDCDTRVNEVREYVEGDTIDLDVKGRGGTILRPAFEYVGEHCEDASLIICFTDMENYDWGDEPHCPVLFAAFGYPDRVKQYLANAPWNSPGIDVGKH